MKVYYDLHMHSCLSPCGADDMTPNNLVHMAALAGLEVLLVLGHCLAGASVFAGLRIAGPELLLSAACFPLAVLLTRLKGHPRRKRKGW